MNKKILALTAMIISFMGIDVFVIIRNLEFHYFPKFTITALILWAIVLMMVLSKQNNVFQNKEEEVKCRN